MTHPSPSRTEPARSCTDHPRFYDDDEKYPHLARVYGRLNTDPGIAVLTGESGVSETRAVTHGFGLAGCVLGVLAPGSSMKG